MCPSIRVWITAGGVLTVGDAIDGLHRAEYAQNEGLQLQQLTGRAMHQSPANRRARPEWQRLKLGVTEDTAMRRD